MSEYGLRERVQLFASSNATFLQTLGHDGTANGEFNRPEGLDVDGQGRLYVADSCNHRIQVFSGDGKWLASYGSAGRGKGQLSYPYDVRVDEAGFQFVCEFGNSRIQVFDRENQPVEMIGRRGERARASSAIRGASRWIRRGILCRGCAEPSGAKVGRAAGKCR